ncbi:hypothetical protein QCA50_016053 [Cerrena zonata]|uniref:Uncharacterized protein n=1 Tax=Cerrena zonata TaxID=2478898 RepID=A0AAW0FGQ7_9APHY
MSEENRPLLFRVISDPSIYDSLFATCSAMTLVLLLRTCSRMNQSVKDYISRAFNINHLLSQYFSDPMAFRYVQACTATIIAGSSALQFFDRSFYRESDLDLYVPMPQRVQLGRYLLREGYKFVPTSWQHPTFEVAVLEERVARASTNYGQLKGIAGVFTFKKPASCGQELKIQIMVACRSTMDVVLRYHSTCVMNIITFNRAYCLYPRTTLEDRISLICTDRDDAVIQHVYERYRRRGWTLVTFADDIPLLAHDSFQVDTRRWIGGGHVWSIHLPCTFLPIITPVTPCSIPLTCDPISTSRWTLTYSSEATGKMKFLHYRDAQLYYWYISDNIRMSRIPSVVFLLDAARKVNVHSRHHFHQEEHHYVDERFIRLWNDFNSIIL